MSRPDDYDRTAHPYTTEELARRQRGKMVDEELSKEQRIARWRWGRQSKRFMWLLVELDRGRGLLQASREGEIDWPKVTALTEAVQLLERALKRLEV